MRIVCAYSCKVQTIRPPLSRVCLAGFWIRPIQNTNVSPHLLNKNMNRFFSIPRGGSLTRERHTTSISSSVWVCKTTITSPETGVTGTKVYTGYSRVARTQRKAIRLSSSIFHLPSSISPFDSSLQEDTIQASYPHSLHTKNAHLSLPPAGFSR